MNEQELTDALSKYAEQAVAKVTPRLRFTVNANAAEDDGFKWLNGVVDFYFREGSSAEEQSAEKALRAITEIIEDDDRMECDEEGYGEGQMGITVTVQL